jgi:hypothetical protein
LFDEENREIFVFNRQGSNMLVYSLQGEYKRTLDCPSMALQLYNWDSNTLLCYDNYGIMEDTYRTRPYLLMSKKDGSIVSTLDIEFPVRFANAKLVEAETPEGNKVQRLINLTGFANNRHDGKDFIVGEMFSDTIYQLTRNSVFTPLLSKTPSVFTTDPKISITPFLKTDNYLFLHRLVLDFPLAQKGEKIEIENLVYDFTTRQVNVVKFVNEDCLESIEESLAMEISTDEKSVGVFSLNAATLVDSYALGSLEGKLDEIASTLKPEDNCVLMILKFK